MRGCAADAYDVRTSPAGLDTRPCRDDINAVMPIEAPSAEPSVTVDCPAKINLHLRVGPARADGFHPLMSWMTTVGLFDTLTMARVRGAPVPQPSPFSLTCDPPTLPGDDRNLVVRMVKAWAAKRTAAGLPVPDIAATLNKRTPSGAGLGGGSSDAACALIAIERLVADSTPGVVHPGRAPDPTTSIRGSSTEDLSASVGLTAKGRDLGTQHPAGNAPNDPATGTSMSLEEMSALAAMLGSDIPFFFGAPSAVCTGRGEVVRPIGSPNANWAVLILPPIHMPTPDVYRKFDAMGLGRQQDVDHEPDWAAWLKLPAAKLMANLVNDLEAPAFAICPELNAIRTRAERKSVRPVRMSGSGSSLFTLFGDERTANEVCDYLRFHLREFRLEEQMVMVVRVGVPVSISSP